MKTKPFYFTAANAALIIMLMLSIITFSRCNDPKHDNSRNDLNDFNAYVVDHRTASEKYADQNWDEMDREFNERKMRLDKDLERMDEEAKKNYQKTVADWETYKSEFKAKQEERKQMKEADEFKMKLLPSGTNVDLKSVKANELSAMYIHFYDVVEKNKDAYTKEEWNHINNLWINMNYIKDGYDKNHEIPDADLKKINNVRLKYTAIKALNRPFADSEHK